MVIKVIVWSISACLLSIIYKVICIILRNYKAHQFFKLKAPLLPTLPSPNIFSGHLSDIIWAPNNYKFHDKYYKETGKKVFGGYYCEKPLVGTIDLDFIKRVVLDEPDTNINRFDISVGIRELEENNLLTATDDQWRRIRKAVAPAFSSYKVKTQNIQDEINSVIDNYMSSIANKLAKAAAENGEASIVDDVEESVFRYSTDLVFTCFYKQTNLISYNTVVDSWTDRQTRGGHDMDDPIAKMSVMFPFTKPLVSWLLSNFHDQGKMMKVFGNFIKKQTKLYLKAQQEIEEIQRNVRAKDDGQSSLNVDNFELKDGSKFKRNMMDYVIEEFRQGKLMLDELKNTSLFLFFAGNRTSSDAMSKLIYHLAMHPKYQDKLRESILEEGTESEYLSWCILESMRLFPPVLLGCSRTLGQDLNSSSGLVPKGSYVVTSIYTIHRWKEYWGEDAEEFKPERWMEADKFHPCQYLAFGAGKRSCPGKDFAMQQMKMLMNRMLREYKFEKAIETPEKISFKSPYLIYNITDHPIYIRISLV